MALTKRKIAKIYLSDFDDKYHIYDIGNFNVSKIGHKTKADAMRDASAMGYTHARGNGTYWMGGVERIPRKYRDE